MTKNLKRFTAIIISIAVLVSAIVFTGATGNDDLNVETVDTSDGWSRTIGFEEYKVVPEQNAFVLDDPDGTYGEYSGKPYFDGIDDTENPGNKLLHYYNYSGASSWAPNWSITPTPTGETNTNSDPESGQVLPTNSRFRLTFRLHMIDTGGGKPYIGMFYGAKSGRHSTTLNKTRTDTDTLASNIKASEEWQEIVVYFDTPSEYTTLTAGVANRLYVGIVCNNKKMKYDLDYIKLEKIVSITYDANGGTFSDGSTDPKTLEEVDGAEFTVDSPSMPGKGFYGWSLDADGGEVLSKVEASHSGNTLYAVWGDPGPHPDDGVYSPWGRTIEFDEYVVTSDNTSIPKGDDYGELSGVPYFSVIDDPDEEGDKILHYYNHSAASSNTQNWSITPTPTGETNTNSDPESGQVLPVNTKFKMTLRLLINDDDGGAPSLMMFYGTDNGYKSRTENKSRTAVTKLVDLKESTEWQEISVYFTTPAQYTTFENGNTANRLYVGVRNASRYMNYDLDYIKLEKVTATNLYLKQDNGYVLFDTLEGVPGTTLTIPDFTSQENYSLHDPTGSYTETYYSNWYSDEACTKAAIMKYGDYDVNLYCEPTVEPAKSTENQEMFVGFDTYTQRTEGLKNAIITDETYYSGTYSLKASDGAAFELKNDHTLDLLDGKTYKVDFMYKADADASFGIGIANGSVANGVTAKNTTTLAAAEDWTAASITFTADGAVDNSVLAATVTGANVYIDTMIVSSATESVGVEAETTENGEALRFMLSYTGADNVITMAGNDYTVTEHGVIVKGQEVDTALTIENADNNSVYHFAQTDLSNNWSVNPITGTTVYSAYLNGFEKNDDYKVSVRGYVKLANEEVFYTDVLTASVTDIPAAGDIIPENADLTDYYVYLPAGTTLPADADYTVTTYDDAFKANNAVENNLVTEGSYAIFSARPDFDKINVPSELKYMVHAGTKDDLYYGLNAQVVSEKISEVGSDTVNYLFITDIHYSSTSKYADSLQKQAALMVKMANENDDIDFIVIGGDTTTGMSDTKQECLDLTKEALDPFLASKKPVFVLMGNHDDNSYHLLASNNTTGTLDSECIITDLDWQNNIINKYVNQNGIKVVQDSRRDGISKYYYYDLVGKKTRVIALDALDYEAKYDEDGFVLTTDENGDKLIDGMPIKDANGDTDRAKYYSGASYLGYSADQVRWLAEDALGTLPNDYDVIFVSHMGIDETTNSYNHKVWFGENIRDIIKAFNAGGTYTAKLTGIWDDEEKDEDDVSVNANFAGKTGDILSWQFGHQHAEISLYESDVDIWQICTHTANVGQVKEQTYEEFNAGPANRKDIPWRIYTRKLGDNTEACFNAMSVSSERIYRFTVGQGNNEKLVYPD